MAGELQLPIVVGLAGFAFRLIPQIRAWRRSKTTERRMAQKLRTAVRNHNVHQTIAALHEKREIEVPTLENAMVSRAEVCGRIEGIRLRVLARTATFREAGHSRTAATSQVAGGVSASRPYAM